MYIFKEYYIFLSIKYFSYILINILKYNIHICSFGKLILKTHLLQMEFPNLHCTLINK